MSSHGKLEEPWRGKLETRVLTGGMDGVQELAEGKGGDEGAQGGEGM